MKWPISLFMILPFTLLLSCKSEGPDFSAYPSATISNGEVEMLLYLPDVEKGLYRATRFDWSGLIMSARWKGHDYFGYWKPTHDPLVHEDLGGPVAGYIAPGIGYEKAAPGEGFVRIGVGVVKKEDEEAYQWNGTYEILDHGKWKVDTGADWIKFTHILETDMGVSYIYMKKIRLKEDGFFMEHTLQNTGEKEMRTDQFNHNFFMIDGEQSGPAFEITFPFEISTEDDTRGLYVLEGNKLTFSKAMEGGRTLCEALRLWPGPVGPPVHCSQSKKRCRGQPADGPAPVRPGFLVLRHHPEPGKFHPDLGAARTGAKVDRRIHFLCQ
jgi:hypothetical protein